MALDAARTGEAVAQALIDAGLITGTEEEIATKAASAAEVWQVIAGALWAELTAHAELREATAATGIAVSVNTSTGNGSTTEAGPVTGGIQ